LGIFVLLHNQDGIRRLLPAQMMLTSRVFHSDLTPAIVIKNHALKDLFNLYCVW